MAASNTDKFKKLSRRWVGQVGAGGVSDDTTTTIPLSSATNLATDTAVVATIDRVDSNGTPTPALEETVIGVVSGTNLVSCVRGAEGTAQAHNGGAVVEILVSSKGYNDIIDGILVGHTQLGQHTDGLTKILNTSDTTKVYKWDLSGATAGKTMTMASSHTNDRTITVPDATDTLAVLGTAQTYTATQTEKSVIWTNNAITASGNAATVPITHRLSTVTNNSAATLTITMTTTSATNGQLTEVRVLDFSGVAQTLTWVNTEDSTVTAPTTTNGSTTLPLSILFQYNSATSKWRCIGKA
jgi:hypothetical protein